MVLPAGPLLLADAGDAVEVYVRPVGDDLSEDVHKIPGVVLRQAVDRLAQAIAFAAVGEGAGIRSLDDRCQPVGVGVGIGRGPVGQKVSVDGSGSYSQSRPQPSEYEPPSDSTLNLRLSGVAWNSSTPLLVV